MTSKIKVNILADGADNSIITSDGAGSFTASSSLASSVQSVGGIQNTPSWRVGITSQSIAYNTATKLQYNREHQDTDSAYDTSNYRFTVPTGKGGTYLIGAWFRMGTGTDLEAFFILPYVNGSNVENNEQLRGTAFNNSYNVVNMTGTLQLSAGDYLEIYGGQGAVNSNFDFGYSNEGMFWGYKLIGA